MSRRRRRGGGGGAWRRRTERNGLLNSRVALLLVTPRTRAPLYFGGAKHPTTSNVLARKALDSRVRGNDGLGFPRLPASPQTVP
ncbi:hypothetical protein [Lysobacter gummosus]|uniref:hypothetical protein n=1 Tax=Lysobacter gummosus TaxID=262324 RepID=UPI00363F7868